MPQLIIIRDQVSATGDDVHNLECGTTPTDAIIKYFPNGVNPSAVKVYVNNKLMVLPSDSEDPSAELLQALTDKGIIIVALEVKGIAIIGNYFAGALVSAGIKSLIPGIPGLAGQRKDSPNNNLQAQTNIARPYQAYPLIFGSPVSYPDLTGEALVEYVDNVKIVTQLMNVGVGLFDDKVVRAGETPLSNFSGASHEFFEPVNKVVTVPTLTEAFATNEVDGQQLLGVGDSLSSYSLDENGSGLTTYEGTTFTFRVDKTIASDLLKSDFDAAVDTFFLEVNYLADVSGSGVSAQNGIGTTLSVVLDIGLTFYTVTLTSFNGPVAFDNIYDFATPFATENVLSIPLGPINLAVEMEEIWFNFLFNRGLKKTVDIRVNMQQLDGPNGSPIVGPQQSFIFSFTADTLDQQNRTFKGILLASGFYQFTIAREDADSNSSDTPDDTKLEAVYAINNKTNVEYGNVTLIRTIVPATINATSLRENKINLDLTSKLISYDVNTSSVITTPSASRKFADALLHMYVDFFGLDANTLALDELYEIQNRLDAIDPRLATFDFTFDDIDVSLDERMDAILQVARCYKWLDGDVYRFTRNESREFESTTITRRDLAQDSDRDYLLTYNPQLTENFDSVKVEYVEPTFNKKAYIFRKLDGVGNVIDGSGSNPKSIELAGCSEEFNAINRAELEMRTLIYQRYTLTDTMLSSGMFLDKGDMVLYAEQYSNSGDLFDGEILAVNGNIATTSESIIFDPLNTYQVHYTITDGSSIGPFPVTEVVGKPFQFECTSLTQAFVRDSVHGVLIQTGSRYIISTMEELDASRWTIAEKEAQGRNVQLSMINYDDRIYDFDEE